ncbi:hypothetical protein [Nocardia miyunensis]|uniref:hypothetical protein n=1 Tax=Nocardia miyunensis TaxID=282684 RepID=UPI00082D47FE|nr:hypothetical protein [Nocardia miyunensis]
MENWPNLSDWAPLDIRLVKDGGGQIAVTDLDNNVLIGPYPMRNPKRMQQLTDWVRDYVLDSARSNN